MKDRGRIDKAKGKVKETIGDLTAKGVKDFSKK